MRWRSAYGRYRKCAVTAILTAGMMLSGCADSASGSTGGDGASSGGSTIVAEQSGSASTSAAAGEVTLLDVADMFTNRDKEVGYDASDCVKITLQGATAVSDAGSVQVDGNVVTITEEGTYLLSGTLQGQIMIDAADSDKVQLVLDGANVSCESSAALYVKQADKVFVTTAAGSENLLETTGSYVAIDEKNIDGAVFARDDITLNGEGTLTVKSAEGNGIVGKDDLVITCGTYVINAANHGLQGKDSVRIAGSDITITAGEDGIHSGNDEDETVGYTYIAGGDITITAGDDGIHSDTQLVIADGNLTITDSYEGLEGCEIEVAGGVVTIYSSDDGLNAAGGNDGSGTQNMGRGFGEDPFAANENNQIIISGGVLQVSAQGDGIDSNGNLYVNGGEIVVNGPTNNGNGALDFGGSGYIYGGSVIAIGASGMAENFSSESTQCSMLVTTQTTQEAGTGVTLKNASGEVLLSTVSEKTFNSVVFSCAQIQVGETYTVEIGSETMEIEMTDTIYGSGNGMGGFGGGPGGMGGRGGFGDRERMNGQNGFDGQEMPQMPDGQNGFGGRERMNGQNGFDGQEIPQMPDGTDGQNGFGGRGGKHQKDNAQDAQVSGSL